MSADPQLEDLLCRWQEEHERGRDATPDELCANRPELREELERRLTALRRMTRLVEGVNRADAEPPAIPPTVAGYEVLSELGRGGMGVVYKARDPRLKRLVAIKMVQRGVDRESLARFRAEVEAVARLQHPHIVQVHAGGEHEGRPYCVLEYVEGGSLDRRIRGQPQPPLDAARLVMLLARAVHAAHQAGIIHRDLKPGNVLLAPASDEPALNTPYGLPKVADFGLAKCLGDEPGAQTVTGTVLGTPSYMAPEQADSGNGAIGPATDVWALGAILYDLLTGRPPFLGRTTLETLRKVTDDEPISLRKSQPEVPAELEAICLRCLRKSPAQRYPSAAALAEELRLYLETGAAPSAQTMLLVRPASRVRWKWWLAAGTAAALLAAVLAWAPWRGAGPAAPRKQNGGEAVLAPLSGWIDVLVSKSENNHRELLRLHEPKARPLKAGDEIHIKAELNRPAYLYVLWIDTEGKVLPVYPWAGEWDQRPPGEGPVKELRLPEKGGQIFTIEPGRPGMETLVLLARETPLPADVRIPMLLGELGEQKWLDPKAVDWFENGIIVSDGAERAANIKQTSASSNPALRTQGLLKERLGGYFVYSRAVAFGNAGGK